jgi:hypothetical protein
MAEIRYQVRRTDIKQEYSKNLTLAELREKMNSVLKVHGKEYRIRDVAPKDREFGPRRNKAEIMRKISWWARTGKKGSVIAVQMKSYEGPTWRIRKVQVGLPEREPNFPSAYNYRDVNTRLQRAIRVAAAFDYGVRTNGLAYTRYIAGTGTLSQHSRWRVDGCKGNAGDLYFPKPYPIGNDIVRQRKLVGFMRGHAPELDLNMIISETTYYSRESGWGARYYSGIPHVSHTHIEAYPPRSSSPCW